MPSSLRGLAARLFGNPATDDIERRVFSGIMFVGFLTGLLSTLQNLVVGASFGMIALTLIGTVVGLVSYLLSRRFGDRRGLVAVVFSLFLAFLSYGWIGQGGSSGTIGYYFFILLCAGIILFSGAARLIALAALAVTLAGLLLLERFFPRAILPYSSPSERFVDVALALPLCLAMAGAIVYVFYEEYRRERGAKDALLRQVTEDKERVLRSMREKQRLLTMVSHDIANALTLIQGEIALAQLPGRPGNPARAPTLDRIGYACSNIDDIICSVRMMEAVEQGRIALVPRSVDLQRVFENAELLFGDRLRARRMRIVFPELDQDNRFVLAEPRILANQVFNNLISNAIKFSREDTTIHVESVRQAGDLTLCVRDQGIGIPPDLLSKLFELDAKTTRPGIHGEPGTGFGLRTVKSFVDLFGGRIEVASRAEADHPADHGTTVSVRLKAAE